MVPKWEETDEIKQAAPSWDDTAPADAPQEGKTLGGLASNAISDAGQMIGGVGQAIMHPIDTATNVATHLPEIGHSMAHSWGLDSADSGHRLQTLADEAYKHPVSHVLDAASVAIPGLKAAGLMPEAIEGANLAGKAGEAADTLSGMADSRWAKAAGGTLANAKELGANEFKRLGRLARNEGVVTPLNGTEAQAAKLEALKNAAGKNIGDLRAKADLLGDAPKVSELRTRLHGDLAAKYGPGVHAGETGDLHNAMDELDKLEPIDKLEPGEELQGALKKATREGDHTSDPMNVFPHKGTLPQDEYEQFRRAQEDTNYIPEMDVHRPTTHTEIAKTVTNLNQAAQTKAKLLQASGATTDVANKLAELNDASIMKILPPDQAAKYQIALERYSDTSKLGSMLENKTAYEAGGSRNRIVNNLANRVLHQVGYQLTAEGLDKLANVVRKAPAMLGKYGPALVNLGPAALATTAHVLLQKDPAFADTLQKAGISQ